MKISSESHCTASGESLLRALSTLPNNTSSNAYYTYFVDRWGNVTHAGPLAGGEWYDGRGDDEYREFNSDGTLKAVADHYTDGTSDITMFNIGQGSLSSFTADFDAGGSVRDVTETITSAGIPATVVTVTAAQMPQSLQTPGTTTFIEHGIKLLLVNDGSNVNGIVHSNIFWQNVSSTSTQGMHANSVGGFISHMIGEAVGRVVGSAIGASIGYAVGAIVGTVVAGLPGTVVGAEVGAAIGAYVGDQEGAKLGDIGSAPDNAYNQDGGAAYDPSLSSPPTVDQGWSNS